MAVIRHISPTCTPATYDVRIRDAVHTGCIIALNPQLITEPAVLNATVNSTNVTCFGANNGTITITGPTGGYGTYEYQYQRRSDIGPEQITSPILLPERTMSGSGMQSIPDA